MFRSRRIARVEACLPDVYGAAFAASADPAGAADVTQDVLAAAAAGGRRTRCDVHALVEHALVRAVRVAPHPAFAGMSVGEREVIVLARLARYTVPEIAAALGISHADVRSRIRSGLHAATAAAVS